MNKYLLRLRKYNLTTVLSFVVFFIPKLFVSQNSITVELGKNPQKKEAVHGFLHFNDLAPLEKHIKELKPKFWRVGNALNDKQKRLKQISLLHSHNIVPILVITDFFSGVESDWENPLNHKNKFSERIKELYLENGNSVIYDIWNEPDWDKRKGGRENFFEIYKLAYNTIRSLPNGDKAMITAPGTSRFDQEFIEAFLEFCNSNNLRVDILNWHEGGIIEDVLQVQNHIKIAQGWIRKYPKLRIQKIYIPEITWITEQFNPAAAFSYIYIIEKNNASGACKTCWDTEPKDGGNTCWNNSIDGLLDPNGNTRSVWWAYKLYAESLEKRISITNPNENLMSLAYINNQNNLSLLLTNTSKKDIEKLKVSFNNIKKNKIAVSKYNRLQIFEVPNTNEQPLHKLKLILDKKINLKNTNNFVLPLLQFNKLYYVVISKK